MSGKKTTSIIRIAMAITCLVALTGCGVWKKYTANSQIKKVEKKLEEARQKESPKYTSELYSEADSLVTQAKSLVEEKQYNEAIQKANESEGRVNMAIEQVDVAKTRIAREIKEVRDAVEQVRSIIEKAEQSGGEQIAPDLLSQAKTAYASLVTARDQQEQNTVQKTSDYDLLKAQVQEVQDLAQRAYNQTLKQSADEVAGMLANLMLEANAIPAAEYVAEAYLASASEYNLFQAQMQNEEYEKALQNSTELLQDVDEMIRDAKRLRASAYIENVSAEIELLKSLRGLEYALEQMRAANESLVEAQRSFEAQDFDQSFGYSQRALESLDVASQEVLAKAVQVLDRAAEVLRLAEDEGAEEHMPQLLAQARESYGEARLAESAGETRRMLDMGAEAYQLANDTLLMTKKKKADLAIQLADSIVARAIREGAETYTKEPLWQAQRLLEEARKLFQAGKYIEVHPVADEATAAAESVLGALETSADAFAEQARADFRSTAALSAEQYAPDAMRQAMESIASCESNRNRGSYLASHRAAEQAFQLLKGAREQTYRTRTNENLAQTRELIEECRRSGADIHAAPVFNKAVDLLLAAENALHTGNYPSALMNSENALVTARQSKLAKIAAAEAAFAQALGAFASRYANDLVLQGQTLLGQSKIAMDKKDYLNSNTLADQAQNAFKVAEQTAWKIRFEEDIAKLDFHIQKAGEQGALEKAPDLYSMAVSTQASAKALAVQEDYKTAEEHALLGLKQTQDTLEHLGSKSAEITEQLETRAQELHALVSDDAGRQKLEHFVQFLSSVQHANRQDEYARVFDLEKQSKDVLRDVRVSIEDHNLVDLANSAGQLLVDYQRSGLALLAADQWQTTREQLLHEQQMIGQKDYEDSRTTLSEILAQCEAMPELAHNNTLDRLDTLRSKMNEIQQTGGSEMLPGEFEQTLQSYREAQQSLEGEDWPFIYEVLGKAERRVFSMDEQTKTTFLEVRYKDLIRSHIEEMHSLQEGFDGVLKLPVEFYLRAKSSASVDIYKYLQKDMRADILSRRSSLLLDKVKNIEPPSSMFVLHALALETFNELNVMARLFERYGQYDQFGEEQRLEAVKQAFAHYETLKTKSAQLEKLVSARIAPDQRKVSPLDHLFPKGETKLRAGMKPAEGSSR